MTAVDEMPEYKASVGAGFDASGVSHDDGSGGAVGFSLANR